jgi:hypothetical protein
VKIEDIKVGDWVHVRLIENLPMHIGQVMSIWPPYVKVEVKVGGSRQEIACKSDYLRPMK